MARNALPILALLSCVGAAACTRQGAATTNADAGFTFQPDPPTVYVAKVKNILVGLPPTDDEIAKVTADPSSLGSLVDGWMAMPEYQAKMMIFFELAFQQTQITAADFTEDRKSTRLNSSHANISYAVFCLKKKNPLSILLNTARVCYLEP